jgi:hypothetical protein
MSEVQICAKLDWDSDYFGFGVAKVNNTRLTQDQAGQVDAFA